MDRQTFRRILLKSAFRKRKMYEELLNSVPMLKALQVSPFGPIAPPIDIIYHPSLFCSRTTNAWIWRMPWFRRATTMANASSNRVSEWQSSGTNSLRWINVQSLLFFCGECTSILRGTERLRGNCYNYLLIILGFDGNNSQFIVISIKCLFHTRKNITT